MANLAEYLKYMYSINRIVGTCRRQDQENSPESSVQINLVVFYSRTAIYRLTIGEWSLSSCLSCLPTAQPFIANVHIRLELLIYALERMYVRRAFYSWINKIDVPIIICGE